MPRPLPLRHVLLALAVVAVWGTNFVVIKLALTQLPPLLFAALRFLFAALPATLLIPRPQAAWRNLAAYGLLIGVGEFGLLYLAVGSHISPGLASLVIQTQVFFTIGLSMASLGERVQPMQWVALALAVGGILMIALHTDATTTPAGLLMVLGSALCWAGGNMVGKQAGRVDMLGYMVWSSLFAVPPLLLLSLLFEGPAVIVNSLQHAGPGAWGAVLWQSVGNTLFGYAAWGWLLARHPATSIAPMSLAVPVFGLTASSLWLGEALPAWKLEAAALVMAGLALNVAWPRWRARRALRA